MKYIKLFEELKNYYPKAHHGYDDRDKSESFFVVTSDENWVLRNNFPSEYRDNMNAPGEDKTFWMAPSNGSGDFPDIFHYFAFKSEEEANKLVNLINSGPDGYKGQDIGGTEDINLKVIKADWDEEKLPYKGKYYRKYVMDNVDSIEKNTVYHMGDLSFKDDLHNRYMRYGTNEYKYVYANLKGKLKIVSYASALIRTDDNKDLLGF